jgi:hypothetical protein
VLIRRALVDDVLPGGYKVKPGQDIMISVYNIHRSPEVYLPSEYYSLFSVQWYLLSTLVQPFCLVKYDISVSSLSMNNVEFFYENL